jgi:TatD DNase family protein
MAHKDVIEILKNYSGLRGVMHCFTGSMEEAQEYLKMGFYIGINGIIFKLPLDEIIKQIPLEKILVETDCPYLTPPQAGIERNEPIFVKYVVERIAELKNIDFQKVADTTTENAKKLFGI